MPKHLLLEGPIQLGKSTLLRKLLQPVMTSVGGFSSQRMTDDQDQTIAFRIGAAAETPLTVPFHGNENLTGIFRCTDDNGNIQKFPEVFDTLGVSYLKHNEGKKLILLDEIGGAELLNESFRTALYDSLAADIPCIGVIKLEDSARRMCKMAGYTHTVADYNAELRYRLITEFDGKILTFERDNQKIEDEVTAFIKKVCKMEF